MHERCRFDCGSYCNANVYRKTRAFSRSFKGRGIMGAILRAAGDRMPVRPLCVTIRKDSMPPQTRAQRRRQPVRSASGQGASRRAPVRVPEPVDYSGEYASVRRDLWRILLWTIVMMAVMVALFFVLR